MSGGQNGTLRGRIALSANPINPEPTRSSDVGSGTTVVKVPVPLKSPVAKLIANSFPLPEISNVATPVPPNCSVPKRRP
jgi:hypothetical protein